MCGRFTLTDEILHLQEQFEFEFEGDFEPRYNIAPSQQVLAVGSNGFRRKGNMLRWGLVPHWAKDEKIGYKMINARAESLDEKPSFRQAFQNHRCLILADGFYEWQKTEKGKQPYRFVMKDRKPFALAGLDDVWKRDGKTLFTCTIITTIPNDVTRDVHDRMPVILPPDGYDRWITPNYESVTNLKSLLVPYPAEEMEKYPVSSLVNSPKNEMVDCMFPINSF